MKGRKHCKYKNEKKEDEGEEHKKGRGGRGGGIGGGKEEEMVLNSYLKPDVL